MSTNYYGIQCLLPNGKWKDFIELHQVTHERAIELFREAEEEYSNTLWLYRITKDGQRTSVLTRK